MAMYTVDNVHVVSVEAVTLRSFGRCLKVHLAFSLPNGIDGEEIMLETTRTVILSKHDEADAIRLARFWFLRMCELGAEAMEPFRLSEAELAAATKA
ncbi:hypothetical protein JI664_12820 [Rhodobacter sp. NTK016B]|uniref:hypothetical protein n=1 Tax=Rhodobacter sp. NTK016B TaxID=2759676 RepID=UPI001A8DBC7F|nr:hypothetical protein [Rhodobacter sp. NTK016B]MBN8292850.1 hypothetical protein [Rhodobacter sp. NTK016B]